MPTNTKQQLCIKPTGDPITCYQCRDLAENTTCSNPLPVEPDPEVEVDPLVTLAPDLPTITCKKGACIKWTYYLNGRYQRENEITSEMQNW